MVTLGCLVAAGLALGIFFNAYALATFCLAVALANFTLAFSVGVGHAAMSMVLCLVFLQVGYFVGLSASAFIFVSKPASVPRSRM
jgi:hypothetical protein